MFCVCMTVCSVGGNYYTYTKIFHQDLLLVLLWRASYQTCLAEKGVLNKPTEEFDVICLKECEKSETCTYLKHALVFFDDYCFQECRFHLKLVSTNMNTDPTDMIRSIALFSLLMATSGILTSFMPHYAAFVFLWWYVSYSFLYLSPVIGSCFHDYHYYSIS